MAETAATATSGDGWPRQVRSALRPFIPERPETHRIQRRRVAATRPYRSVRRYGQATFGTTVRA